MNLERMDLSERVASLKPGDPWTFITEEPITVMAIGDGYGKTWPGEPMREFRVIAVHPYSIETVYVGIVEESVSKLSAAPLQAEPKGPTDL